MKVFHNIRYIEFEIFLGSRYFDVTVNQDSYLVINITIMDILAAYTQLQFIVKVIVTFSVAFIYLCLI